MEVIKVSCEGKPKGYLEAIRKLWEKNKEQGIWCEISTPNMEHYRNNVIRMRLRQFNPSRVGCVIRDIDFGENEIVYHYEPHGCFRDMIRRSLNQDVKFGIAARMMVRANGSVEEVCWLDILPEDQIVEINVEKLT